MASPLEALPNEILDFILKHLVNHDIGTLKESDHINCFSLCRLSQCSRFLRQHLEPLLYKTLDARDAALRHGCMTGNLDAIRKVAFYGSNLDAVRSNLYVPLGRTNASPTLQVALKASQLEAFKLLLDLGVGITPQDYTNSGRINSQLTAFAKRLAQPWNEAFLEAVISARAETPLWKDNRKDNRPQSQVLISRLPFPHVVRWASPTLLEILLDHGASLDETCTLSHVGSNKKPAVTPLGAACFRGDILIFDLLVARGAQVDPNDSLRNKHPTTHTHIPVFMAALYMSRKGMTEMIDACVAAGVNINQTCHVRETRLEGDKHICTTPLLTYLSSIESWNTDSFDVSNRSMTPSQGVAHFINALGANIASPVAPPIKYTYGNPTQELYDRTFAQIPSPVELLLTRWGIKSLRIPEFFAVIKLLVEQGGTGPDLSRLLVRIDGQNEPSSSGDMVDIEELWQKFLALLMPQLNQLDQAQKDALLRRVIVDKASMRNRVVHPSYWVKVKAIGRATISTLIRAGANINHLGNDFARYPDMNTPLQKTPLQDTPLHRVVSTFVHTDSLSRDHLHDHPRGQDCPYTKDVMESFGGFLSFLVGEGADPLIENTAVYRDEKTAIDTLLSPMREGRLKLAGGTVEQGLMSFVARLRGQSNAPDSYTGERKPYDNTRDYLRYLPSTNCEPESVGW
ncbi:hypothetical protein DM02DRAFT_613480 [Periconia macrospinosa]|uniref:Uncharacterized protein n=1 Tax=Periconia macrospinosa TaxID=97972 RepID=A0A2V1DTM8_9PLEO|nr:hypothetical protein DM02DRAFT_613480 [Periconia macrospinosa]